MTNKKKGAPKPQSFSQDLPCVLKAIEIEARREQLEQVLFKREDLATKKAAQMKTINDEDKKLEIEQEQLTKVLRVKTEERIVKCERRFDFDTNKVYDVRLDTGDQIKERPMTGEERDALAQGDLLPPPEEAAPETQAPAKA